MLSGGELLASVIGAYGIDTVFGLVGNQISPVLVQLDKYNIDFVGCHHEQAAVLMADGWAQVKRTSGVSMVSGGPGFANCLNGIIKAYMVGTPLIVIVGGIVQTKKDDGQLQDMNQLTMIKDYCKWCAVVNSPERIPEYFSKAYEIANTNKRGPVVLEIPIDILKAQTAVLIDNQKKRFTQSKSQVMCAEKILKEICTELEKSNKPILLLGDEVYYEKCEALLERLTQYINIPIYSVNKGRGLISEKVPFNFGSARTIDGGSQLSGLPESDLIIAIGISDDYQLNSFHEPYFKSEQKIISVTETTMIIQHKFKDVFSIKINVYNFLHSICDYIEKENLYICKNEWISQIQGYSEKIVTDLNNRKGRSHGAINPSSFITELNKLCSENTIIVLDGSNAMFWGSLLFEINYPGQLIIAPDGTHGSMGCGLPLALGAKKACLDREVILYTGDGSIGFHIMEMDTSITYNLPIKIVVHNDCAWGLCKTTQQILYNRENGVNLRKLYFDKICESFGGIGITVEITDQEKNSLKEMMCHNKLVCLNVFVDPTAYSPGLISFNELLKGMK